MSWRTKADGRGEPYAALRTTEYLDAHHGLEQSEDDAENETNLHGARGRQSST